MLKKGDLVVGNPESSRHYLITDQNSLLEVADVEDRGPWFTGKLIKTENPCGKYWEDGRLFDGLKADLFHIATAKELVRFN